MNTTTAATAANKSATSFDLTLPALRLAATIAGLRSIAADAAVLHRLASDNAANACAYGYQCDADVLCEVAEKTKKDLLAARENVTKAEVDYETARTEYCEKFSWM